MARNAITGRWMVCEKAGRWAAALRWANADGDLRLYETRSLLECRDELARWPASFVVLAATVDNVEGVLRLLLEVQKHFPWARAAIVADRSLSDWEFELREAGAIHIVYSPRGLASMGQMAARHLARLPRPKLSIREAIWTRLPWSEPA